MSFIVLILILILAPTAIKAENPGIIQGTVTDMATGETLPGAAVSLIGTKIGAVTDADGRFIIRNVPAGTYSVQVFLIGYSAMVMSDIVVSPSRPAEISIEMTQTTLESDEEVVVRPDFFLKPVDANLSVQSQSSEEIRRLPGSFEDVVRATANLPGVAQVQAGRNDLIVRGGAPSENLYLVDNIELSNINHFGTQGASGGPLSFINLDFVENIRFYTGGFGVKYGDKLSSALDIRLRDGRTDRIGGKATISASQFGLNLEGPIGDNGSFLFSARRSYLDLIFKAAGFEFVPEYWDFFLKTKYQLDRKNSLSFLGIAALDNIRFFNEDSEDLYENSRRLDSDQKQIIGGLSWRHLIPDGSVTISAGQHYTKYDYRQNDTLLNPIFISDSYESETYLRADGVYLAGRNLVLSSGLQTKLLLTKGDIFLDSFTSSYGEFLSIDEEHDITTNKSSGYLQLSKDFRNLRLAGGIRVDYFGLIDKHWTVAPRLSSSLGLSESFFLNGSVGRYYQAPSVVWIASNPYNKRLSFVGNDQYIAGFEYRIRDDTRLTIEGYYKRYFNVPASIQQEYIVMSNSGGGFGGAEESFTSFGIDSLQSEGKGRSYGMEIFAEKKLSEIPCYGTISLSFGKSEYAAIDGVWRDGSYDQTFIGNLSGGYIFNQSWEIATRFRIATGRPYTPYDSGGNQDPDLYNSRRVVTNHSLDFRVDKRWFFKGWTLITYLDIENIYNRKAREVPRYNAREGEIETINEIGIFPTLGISAEF
ncbi:MAG: TonB-dependent receptor plug domain-containing protein [candidate division Zixibacteria bacterium]|nr:TonB-dependent receptor plug domain-containing protein [candidate division Zixibacteria bacterium]